PDIAHVNNYKGLSLAVFSAVKNLDIPLIFTAHDYSLICPRANLLQPSGEVCAKQAYLCKIYAKISKYLVAGKVDMLTAPSQFVIDKLKSNGLFTETSACKLPVSITLNILKSEKNYNQINILYVGQVNKPK